MHSAVSTKRSVAGFNSVGNEAWTMANSQTSVGWCWLAGWQTLQVGWEKKSLRFKVPHQDVQDGTTREHDGLIKSILFLFSFKKKNYTWYVPQRVGKLLWSQFLRDIYQLPVVFGDTPAVDLHICLCTNGSWSWHGCPNETSATTKLGLDWKFTGISWQIQEDNWDSDKTGMKTCSPIHVQWHLYWGPLLMSPMIAPPRSRPTVSPEVSDRRDDGRC